MTRRGIERERFLAFVSMTRNGAEIPDALAYIDMMWPLPEHR